MPEDQPRFVGWYSHHRIRIYKDDDECPWRVVFDPGRAVDAEGKQHYRLDYPEARERTADAAKITAQALAQNAHLRHLPYQEHIDWTDLAEPTPPTGKT